MADRKHARLKALPPRLREIEPRRALPPPHRPDPFYLTAEWRGLVARLLRARGRRCQNCGRTGCRIFADHAAELQDGGAPFDERNIMLLCGSCHSAKTARERARHTARHYE